ncbi:asparagine synthase-related protein [Paenibacillus glufosinatiresistens]|uniref:asparagine synthase-related protein n=1 Tax=Paenibacillus glufosinatiresistens TaxID=3070657 RepID=UPI00286E0B1A|nr:asparagine synthase-related protein [Paenibacillus sp. YX.27]
MAAISGMFALGRASGVECAKAGAEIWSRLNGYRFDRTGEWGGPSGWMSCGLVFNTPESRRERLPFSREIGGRPLAITADAIIDNRSELLEQFGISSGDALLTPDSELILRAYAKWGTDCVRHLIGDYAFAVWDKKADRLFLARDPMGSRSLYYTHSEQFIAFCTLERPLLGTCGYKPELNERWIADFLAIEGIPHETQCEETIYRHILQLPPAHYAVVQGRRLEVVRYWDSLRDIKPVRYAADQQYVEAFNRIFEEAVACRLRSAGEVGIFLSGGMDSGSIASVAAPLLEREGRKLYGYTSVPLAEFKEQQPSTVIYNESPEVMDLVRAYPNIEPYFSSLPGESSFSSIDELLAALEHPYKIFQNGGWLLSFMREASGKGCTLMLNGQTGNGTISYGVFPIHMKTLFRQGRWLSLLREMRAVSRQKGVPVRKVALRTLPVLVPYRLKAWKNRKALRRFDRYEQVPVSRSLAAKWSVADRLDRMEANLPPIEDYPDYGEDQKSRADLLALAHIGAIETKLSLAARITVRDPSRDRRVYEFCMGIPYDQYVKNGQDRRLLRRAMEGKLPDSIRLNTDSKGVQSADWLFRLGADKPALLRELSRALDEGEVLPYVEEERLRAGLRLEEGRSGPMDDSFARMALTTIILARFIQKFNTPRKEEAE